MKKLKKTLTVILAVFVAAMLLALPLTVKLPHEGKTSESEESNELTPTESVKAEYYTVTFDVGEYGVESNVTQEVKMGEKPELFVPECKYKSDCTDDIFFTSTALDDYAFKGWYYDGELITEENCPAFNKDVTLIARWIRLWTDNY